MTRVSFTVPGVPHMIADHVCPVCDGEGVLHLAESEQRRTLSRFFAKVDLASDAPCWRWTAASSHKGYGSFGFGPKGKLGGIPAHRAAYLMFVGPIPAGMVIDHLCRNRACVNPMHLEPVTDRENILRGEGLAAQFARRTHCERGHEFTPENTIWRTDRSRPARRCRECRNARERRLYFERKVA